MTHSLIHNYLGRAFFGKPFLNFFYSFVNQPASSPKVVAA